MSTHAAAPRPLTPRGERTRAALVTAARAVFERDGFLDTRLADIAAAAGCSVGTFYSYFENKEQILTAVLEVAEKEMLRPARPQPEHGGVRSERELDPRARIEAAHRSYFTAYRRNARLMLLMEQVATLDPRLRDFRRRRGWTFTDRNAESIATLQREGWADPGLDPVMSARALSGMVARMAYHAYALGELDPDGPQTEEDEALVRTATTLWVNALAIRSPLRP